MKEIEVEEYVRTTRGIIFIYDKEFAQDVQAQDFSLHNDGKIVKHSHDIIDLIEVGDFLTILADGENLTIEVDKIDYKHKLKNIADDIKIKSIVTKEQFAQAEYRLEG